jgi:hypothetical protein
VTSDWLRLRIPQIERAFIQVPTDLQEILVLDGVDLLPDLPGFRIRSHDLYGSLPDVVIKDTGDRWAVLEDIHYETAKLIAMVRVRKNLAEIFPGCEFLLPTSTGEGALVGLRFRGRTVLAEERIHWEAYHQLMMEAVEKIL